MAESLTKTYRPIPTLQQFHCCDATTRCVVGPVGSGKTTAASWEICYYIPKHLFAKHGIKQTRWVVLRNCYDDQTEVLTEKRGWVLFKDLGDTDRVAMLQDGKTVFTLPTYYYQSDYVGEMIGFESEGLDFLVTPDHKLSVSLRNARRGEWSDYRLRKAKDCYGKTNMRVRRDAEWDGVDPGLTPEMFEWLGYWFAEGSTTVKEYNGSRRHNCIITTKNDFEYAKSLFEVAGLPYTVHTRNDGIHYIRLSVTFETKPLILKLNDCGKAVSKSVPAEWKNAPVKHLRRFIKGYLAGDGSHRKNDSTICAVTSSRALADDLQEMALRAGYVVNVNDTAECRESMVINGVQTRQTVAPITVTFLTGSKYRPHLVAKDRYRGWYKQSYSGKVYCVEVPTHLIYVRRNGRAFWCSQTYRELEDTTKRTILFWFDWGTEKKQDAIYILSYKDYTVEILFRSCDRPGDVSKFKSLELTGYWIDESIEVPIDVKLMLKNRIGRFPPKCPERFGIETTNPPDIEDPTYYNFKWLTKIPGPMPEQKPLVDHYGFWQPPRENDANLRPRYYDDLIQDYQGNRDWIERYIMGKPGITVQGRVVYNNFSRERHVAKEPIEFSGRKLYAGWDNTGNCPACVVGYIPSPGIFHVLKEYHTERMGIVDFANYVLAYRNDMWPGVEWVDWCDPAGEARFSRSGGGLTSNADMMRDLGIRVIGSEQNWDARKESVEFQLGRMVGDEPAFLVDPGCTRLINGFIGGYCYPETAIAGVYSDRVEKNKYSHVHDALQYMMAGLLRNYVRKVDHRDAVVIGRTARPNKNIGYQEVYA